MEKSKVIEKLFGYIVTYSYLILPILLLLTRTRKRDAKILAVYGIVFWSLLFFYKEIPKEFRKVAYQPIYTSLEYLFFASLFYFNIETKSFKRTIFILSGVFLAFQVIYILALEKSRVDSISIGVESILIFIYISLFFLENLSNARGEHIYSNHCFWISAGLLFYLGGSFFINILASSFSDVEFTKYFYLNYVADTVKTILFAVAFILLVKKSKNKSNQRTSHIPYLDMV